jgi:hypothetical protein
VTTPVLRIPTICPKCGVEGLVSLPVDRVAAGLMRGKLKLRGACRHRSWEASEIEREQIRQYLSTPVPEGVSRDLWSEGAAK